MSARLIAEPEPGEEELLTCPERETPPLALLPARVRVRAGPLMVSCARCCICFSMRSSARCSSRCCARAVARWNCAVSSHCCCGEGNTVENTAEPWPCWPDEVGECERNSSAPTLPTASMTCIGGDESDIVVPPPWC